MLPPAADVLSDLVAEHSGILGVLIFVSEAVNDVVGLGGDYVNALLVADLGIVFFEHRNRCLEGGGQLILYLIFLEDISETDRSDVVEEVGLLYLIGEGNLIVDECSNEQLAICAQFLLSVCDERGPVAVEAGHPLLTLR